LVLQFVALISAIHFPIDETNIGFHPWISGLAVGDNQVLITFYEYVDVWMDAITIDL
jgi:hypothetical protein